jgi:hypothetical protein
MLNLEECLHKARTHTLYEHLRASPSIRGNSLERNVFQIAASFNDYKAVLYMLKIGVPANRLLESSELFMLYPEERIIQILIVFGLDVHRYLAFVICGEKRVGLEKLLIANGARLQIQKYRFGVPAIVSIYIAEMQKFKTKVITILTLKRRRIHAMLHLDRFLMKELALAIWAERYKLL